VKLLSPTISRLARMRWWKIDQWMEDAVQCQYDIWQNLISSAEYTQIGKQYKFGHINSIAAYQETVPLHSYENIQQYIAQMMGGDENVLWNTPIEWYAKSSGTTNTKSKFIPVSYESLKENHFLASKDVLSFYYKNNPQSDLLVGKGLVIGGSNQSYWANDNIQLGDVSAVIMQNGPFWSNWLRTPSLDIALLTDWEEKLEKMADATIIEDVTSLAGVPTWTLLLLKRILEKTGKSTIKEVWPHLELYLHGGVNFAPYKDQFDAIIGEPIHYMEVYNASEGLFAAQNDPDDDGMALLTNHGIFYEFVAVEDIDLAHPKAYTLDQVELGKNYAIIISTYGGLWRYVIGDTVKFTSLAPYKIKITGRTKHFINAFGEELMVNNADDALRTACNICNATINDYTAAPIYFANESNGAHEWIIEFEKEPLDMDAFTYELDKALQKVNSDYEAKRHKNIALGMPVVHKGGKGIFNLWLKQKGKLGGQHKVPRLSNNRLVLEEVKGLL
jgi:hypothetical protein